MVLMYLSGWLVGTIAAYTAARHLLNVVVRLHFSQLAPRLRSFRGGHVGQLFGER